MKRRDHAFVFAFAVAAGLAEMVYQPGVYGGDPILRITNWHHLLLSHQLPLMQVLVHVSARITPQLIFLRLVLILMLAAAACGFARLASAFGASAGLIAGLLFAANHLVLYLAGSPFQEVLELGLLFWALALIFEEERAFWRAAGFVLLALACLTRYEAWFAAAAGALVALIIRRRDWPAFAIGPLLWICFQRGLSAPGTMTLDPVLRFARLYRIPHLLGATFHATDAAVVVFALAGLLIWWYNPRLRTRPAWAVLLLAVGFFLLALPASAHGVTPDFDRYVTTREAHFVLPVVLLFAAAGIASLRQFQLVPAAAVLLVIFSYEAAATKTALDSAMSDGNLLMDIRIAHDLERRTAGTGAVLVFARPFRPQDIAHYTETIGRRQGQAGLDAARRSMASMNVWPLDYARIWTHASRIRDRLRPVQSAGTDQTFTLALVFDDYAPANDAERALLGKAMSRREQIEGFTPALRDRAAARLYRGSF